MNRTTCVQSVWEAYLRKMTRLQTIQLNSENFKHRWAAKGYSSKYIATMIIITLHNSPSKLLCPTRQSCPSRHRHHIGQVVSDRELAVKMLGDCSRWDRLS